MAASTEDRSLVIDHLTVAFGSHRALDDISLSLASGRVHGLLGPNGSGKSTLIKFLSGVVPARRGVTVKVRGVDLRSAPSPAAARDLGLRFVHQDMGLVPDVSILDNLYLSNAYPTRAGQIRWGAARKEALATLDSVGLRVDPRAALRTLGHADRVLVAVARSLMRVPASGGFLFLDEPTAALEEGPSERLLSSIRELTQKSIGVVLVTHRLREVLRFADSATVLRDGRIQYGTERVSPLMEGDLLDALGASREGSASPAHDGSHRVAGSGREERVRHEAAVILRGLDGQLVRDVDLTVNPGEIVGVTGLEGSGKEELFHLLTGRARPSGGTVTVLGSSHPLADESDVLARGVGIVPGDRLTEGGIGDLTTAENLFLPHFSRFWQRGSFHGRSMNRQASEALVRYGVEPPAPQQLFGTLSGGNQQKTIVARWMMTKPRLLLLQEPTAGVDVSSRYRIYEELRGAAADGVAAVIVSSDVAELAELCDRVVVMVDGRVGTELAGSDLTHENLTLASFEADQDGVTEFRSR